jgi:hypothetical protein
VQCRTLPQFIQTVELRHEHIDATGAGELYKEVRLTISNPLRFIDAAATDRTLLLEDAPLTGGSGKISGNVFPQ